MSNSPSSYALHTGDMPKSTCLTLLFKLNFIF